MGTGTCHGEDDDASNGKMVTADNQEIFRVAEAAARVRAKLGEIDNNIPGAVKLLPSNLANGGG